MPSPGRHPFSQRIDDASTAAHLCTMQSPKRVCPGLLQRVALLFLHDTKSRDTLHSQVTLTVTS